MDYQASMEDLQKELMNVVISSQCEQESMVKANSVVAPSMPWEKNPNQIHQFNETYLSRLSKLAKRINLPQITQIQDVDQKSGDISIVGIFKRIQIQRKRAYDADYHAFESAITTYDTNDVLSVEDASGSVRFIFDDKVTFNGKQSKIQDTELPYGVIIGLRGCYNDKKHYFVVKEFAFPSLPPQKLLQIRKQASPRKMLVISEPSIGSLVSSLKEIVDYQFETIKRQIKTVVVMGLKDKICPQQIKELDEELSQYSKFVDIFIMQGGTLLESFPQKPLHPIMFRNSYKSVGLVSNPQYFEVTSADDDDIQAKMLFFSGQNVNDMIKNRSYAQDSSINALQSIFQYSHMAPTTPFSLKSWMMPEDYLVIDELPHLAIAGQCKAFQTKEFQPQMGKKVKLVTMKSNDMALIDIDDLRVDQFHLLSPSL